MKKNFLKKLIIGVILLILVSFILPQTSKSVLQANPTTNNSPSIKTGTNWLSGIRNMEKTGQAMGLSETINSTSLLSTTDSNGIDVHMMKSTEYGAMAILSASGFGNPANTTTIDTTTGNKTGVYMQTAAVEWVAGAGTQASGMSGSSISHRYFNTYGSVKPGDALNLIWHNPTHAYWGTGAVTYRAMRRGGSWGVFGFDRNNNPESTSAASRAAIVVGEGF